MVPSDCGTCGELPVSNRACLLLIGSWRPCRWSVFKADRVPAGLQSRNVAKYCSDLVCSENCIISGHYDGQIRAWDSRLVCRTAAHLCTT